MKVGVFGAGAIGCYLGGALAAEGVDVTFVGRTRHRALVLEDLDGTVRHAPAEFVDSLDDREVILCCVKSAQTAEAAERLPRNAVVVSMQNGLRAAEILRSRLPDVRAGIVGFNVVSKGDGVFRRTTTGPLVIESPAPIGAFLRRVGFDVDVVEDIRARQWSKLIMNLNNAVSALTDQPTPVLLFDGQYRRILAALMGEAVQVLRATKTKTARVGPLPATLFPAILRLPTPLLRVVAAAQLKVDPEARSSMWEDLSRGRDTEVDDLNGELVRLAESHGLTAPLNRRIVELVHAVEAKRAGSPRMSASELWAQLTHA